MADHIIEFSLVARPSAKHLAHIALHGSHCDSKKKVLGLPWYLVKNPPASAADTSLIPGPGRLHMARSRKAHEL